MYHVVRIVQSKLKLAFVVIVIALAQAPAAFAAPDFTPDMFRYNLAKQFRGIGLMIIATNPNFQGAGRIQGRQDPNGMSCGQIPVNKEECELLQDDAYVKVCLTTPEFQALVALKSYPVCNGQGRGLNTLETWCACDY